MKVGFKMVIKNKIPKFRGFDNDFKRALLELGLYPGPFNSQSFENIEDIFDFVLKETEVYFPEKLKNSLISRGMYSSFIDDLKNELIFYVYVICLFKEMENSKEFERFKSTSQFAREMLIELGYNSIPVEDDSRAAKDNIKTWLSYDPFLKNFELLNNYKPPLKFQAPYFFTHFKEFRSVNDIRLGRAAEETKCKFINTLIKNIKQYDKTNTISRFISYYLMELNYNPYLFLKIKENESKFKEKMNDLNVNYDKSEYIETFSLISLSPDVYTRNKFLEVFYDYFDEKVYDQRYGSRSFITNKKIAQFPFSEIMADFRSDIIKYSLIYQPILKSYTFYLIGNFKGLNKDIIGNNELNNLINANLTKYSHLESMTDYLYGSLANKDIFIEHQIPSINLNESLFEFLETWDWNNYKEDEENQEREEYCILPDTALNAYFDIINSRFNKINK